MIRIAVFSNMYPSKAHPTFGIFVKNQVDLLRTADVQVDVIAIDDPRKGKGRTLKKYMLWFFRSLFYMMKNRKKLTLTHAHYAFPTGLLSLIGKKFFGIPYVVTVHGGDIDKMAAKSARIAKLTGQVLMGAETVIVVGEKLKEDVTGRFGVPEARVEVMSMGVDSSVFKPTPKVEARTMLNVDQDKKVILFVGNVIKAKGVLELVDAFQVVKETHPNSSLHIIGSLRDDSFYNEVQVLIQSQQGSDDIHFMNQLSQTDLAQWMAAADVLALPSHHEGFGLVALEAMAAGAKVVGTDVGGLSYLLSGGAGILVQPKDPMLLAEGLQEALNPDSTAIDEAVVRERVTAHSFETVLQNLLSIYRNAGKG